MQLVVDGKRRDIAVPDGQTILDVLRLEYGITCPCGGNGRCGKCKVKVLEKETDTQWKTVLSCMTADVFCADATELIHSSSAQAKVQDSYSSDGLRFEKDCSWDGYSVAVDIGTTTLAMYLIDGNSAEVVDQRTALNPQSAFGSDVISRIVYSSNDGKSKKQIQSVLASRLDQMIDGLISGREGSVDCIQVVGNPTMIYLLAGLDAQELGVAPYRISVKDPFSVMSDEIGMHMHVPVFFPGSVSAFFGSDITCGMVATLDLGCEESFIYTDLGTNGEIAVSDGKRILCCSTAAGPAFEGANISCGIGAVEGAICNVATNDGKFTVRTIGGGKPLGICGSGIIDLTAELIRNGYVDFTGRIDDSIHQPIEVCDGVSFTQKDVREIQLAKSAIRAGIEVLMEMLGMGSERIDKVYISGGFGTYIDIRNCLEMGIFPDIEPSRFVSLGNAAGKGAVSMVHSKAFCSAVEGLRQSIRYVELFDSASFQEKYVDCMMFGEE